MTKPYVSISVITPKPGRFEEFMELQLAQHHRVRGQVQGLRGGRLFRSLDGRSVVLVTAFETIEDAQRFRQDPRLTEHVARVQPLLESAAPGGYETAYEVGTV
ncbi:heme-degrading monooxygenase HmoA [Inquilinus ginsengisoli]|uniref:antibiotic biosynthesis monooxygenase family protein n=1 Tax=Inquilinus ginsengisoli TaxID=363840 RepID=UPI003D25CCD0